MKKLRTLIFFLFLFGIRMTQAQFANLYEWSSSAAPYGSLTLSGNVMYGMTSEGGTNGAGNVFSIHKDGSNYKDLWDFNDTGSHSFNSNGSIPSGNVTLVGNKLYGLTSRGGSNNFGEIFCIDTNGTKYKDIWDFADTGHYSSNTSGKFPYGSLTLLGSKLYGYTSEGGYTWGQIFSIDTFTFQFKDVYDFIGGTLGGSPSFGALAISPSGKTLYGIASYGFYDGGIVFAVDTDGTHFKDLHDLDDSDGIRPASSVALSGSKLFGTATNGGSIGGGTIFTVDTSGHNFKRVYSFSQSTGQIPNGDVIAIGKNLYGMVADGGANGNYGVIFRVDSTGRNYTSLVDFNGIDGYSPFGDLTHEEGDTLFGMTYSGGFGNYGNIFRFVDANIDLGVNTIKPNVNSVSFYPNPSNGNFSVICHSERSEESLSTIEVYNVIGEKVYSQFTIHNSPFTIDLSSNPAGVYLYRVLNDDGSLMGEGKMVIQK